MHRSVARTLDQRAVALVVLSLIPTAARLDAATPAVRVGTEFLVNTTIAGSQAYPTVASTSTGEFVVVWTDYAGLDGSERGVFARRFNSDGIAPAPQFQVNSYTPGAQAIPSAKFDATNRLVIVWTGYGGQDGSSNGIFGRRY